MAEPKRIMDVAHPNQSTPSGNSKSVIVTHRSSMQDPMVNTANTSAEPGLPTKTSKLKLQPLTAPILIPDDKEEASKASSEVESAEPAKAVEAENVASAPAKHVKLEIKPPIAAESDPESKSDPDPEKKSPAATKPEAEAAPEDQGDKGNPIEINKEVIDAEQAKAEAALQKLVDSKQYFLPINTLENRRSRRFVAAGIILSLIMIIAWLDLALDAGLITINGIKPLTHFF